MSLIEIEAELEKLTADELRRLEVRPWTVFMAKEGRTSHACDEDDPMLLSALDDAIAQANANPGKGVSAQNVLARLDQWTSR